MSNFTKLWSQIIDSTIWQEPNDMVVLWIAMLAKKGRDHVVRASIPGLARIAKISIEECEAYLKKMMEPDRYSKSQEHEGRRLLPHPDGWFVVNGEKYQELMRDEQRKEAVRKAVVKHRERKKLRIDNRNGNTPDA